MDSGSGPEREHTELRAERLRVLLACVGEDVALESLPVLASGLVPLRRGDLVLLDSASEADRYLADQLIAIAREIRAREWAALSTLLTIVAERPGDLAARCAGLPGLVGIRCAVACFALGWIGPPVPA